MGSIRRLTTVLGARTGSRHFNGERGRDDGGGFGRTPKFKACVVTDTGGINDKSFNASAWAGLQGRRQAKDSNIVPSYLSSTSSADYAPNIDSFIARAAASSSPSAS